jgi:hypothetical protein
MVWLISFNDLGEIMKLNGKFLSKAVWWQFFAWQTKFGQIDPRPQVMLLRILFHCLYGSQTLSFLEAELEYSQSLPNSVVPKHFQCADHLKYISTPRSTKLLIWIGIRGPLELI